MFLLEKFIKLKWYLLNVLGKEWYHQTLYVNCLGKEGAQTQMKQIKE